MTPHTLPEPFASRFESQRAECELFWIEQSQANSDRTEVVLRVYVALVYTSFLQSACDYAFSDQHGFHSCDLRAVADSFLPKMASEAFAAKHPRAGAMDAAFWKSLFVSEVTREIQNSEEWRSFIQNVKDLADWESTSGGAHHRWNTPHENPEAVVEGKTQVNFRNAGTYLGKGLRTIRARVEAGYLETDASGRMITVASLRRELERERRSRASKKNRQ